MRRESMHVRAETGRETTGRWMMAFVLLLTVALTVSGCGRKGPPKHPEGSEYPQTYPQE